MKGERRRAFAWTDSIIFHNRYLLKRKRAGNVLLLGRELNIDLFTICSISSSSSSSYIIKKKDK